MDDDFVDEADGLILHLTAADIDRIYTCDDCGQFNPPATLVERTCPTGDCVEVVHPCCGSVWSSAGPVLCKSCGDLTWLQRQQHRVEMWAFDVIEMPLRRLTSPLRRKWRNR